MVSIPYFKFAKLKKCVHTFHTLHTRRHTMNDTKLATKTLRMQYWAEIIQDRTTSGKNVIQYCQEHGISKNAYFYWLKKIKNAALESAGIDFFELPDPDRIQKKPNNVNDFDTEAVVSVGNVSISINSHTSKTLLASILEVASCVK